MHVIKHESLPLVKVSGSYYEMGVQHGKQCSKTIRIFVDSLLDVIQKRSAGTGINPEDVLTATHKFLPYMEKYAPYLVEEMNGIADGADLPREKIYLCNLRGELTYQRPRECTTFALLPEITVDNSILIGQNVDTPGRQESQGIMLHLSPKTGPSILTWTRAGTLAHVGINSHGFARVGNGLVSTQWRDYGVPSYLMWRRILEQKSVEDAVQLVTETKRAKSGNLLLADGESIVDIETTALEHRLLKPQNGFIVHSNNYLHPDLVFVWNFAGLSRSVLHLLHKRFAKVFYNVFDYWIVGDFQNECLPHLFDKRTKTIPIREIHIPARPIKFLLRTTFSLFGIDGTNPDLISQGRFIFNSNAILRFGNKRDFRKPERDRALSYWGPAGIAVGIILILNDIQIRRIKGRIKEGRI